MTDKVTAEEAERRVRDAWDRVRIWEPVKDLPWEIQISDIEFCDYHDFTGKSKEEALFAALAFTEERLEAIRQVGEEIMEIEFVSRNFGEERGEAWRRILAREKAALAELRRGMKGGAQPQKEGK